MGKQVAQMTFSANVNGFLEKFVDGVTIVDDDHPSVREYPSRFKAVPAERKRPEVEEATAGPGVKRGERR